MQTLLSRMGDLLTGFLSVAEQPENPDSGSVLEQSGERAEEDRLPARDESYYWAMHAHW